MRVTIAFLLLLTLPAVSHAQTPRVERIEIFQSGIFKTEVTKTTATPGAVSGNLSDVENIRHVRTTTAIPGQLGLDFGYGYRVIGTPRGVRVTLRFVTIVPSPGMRDPKTGNTTLRGEYSQQRTVGEEAHRLYGFDEAWEIVPGVWTLEIWQGDRKLASQSFTVAKP